MQVFKENLGKYPESLENINDYISITEEQKEFLYKNYVFNGYLRASHFDALNKKYPELYNSLFIGKYEHGRKFIAINIINLLNLSIEEDPKCLICGKSAKWNNAYKCWFATDCSECGRKLSAKGKDETIKEKYNGAVNSSQTSKYLETKNRNLYYKVKSRIEPEYTLLVEEKDFKGHYRTREDGTRETFFYPVRHNICGTVFEANLETHFTDGKGHYTDLKGIPRCPKCYPIESTSSIPEKEVRYYIESIYKGKLIKNTRRLLNSQKELDIYLPDKNFAIEFDGIAWHSDSAIFSDGNKKDKYYHLSKTNICNSKGIDLLHIFENDWTDLKVQPIIKSIIKHKLGNKVKIKNCIIKELSKEEIDNFFKETNLFGSLENSVCNIGLVFNNKIIAAFSYNEKDFRFSQDLNCEVKDAFSILLKASHISNFTFKIDRRYFTGNTLRDLSLKEISPTEPEPFYITKGNRLTREEIKGASKIWDCGSFIFEI